MHLYVDYKHIHLSPRYNLFTLKCRFLLLCTFSIFNFPLFFVLFSCLFVCLVCLFIPNSNLVLNLQLQLFFIFDLPWGCADGVVAVKPFVAFAIEYSVAFCILTRGRCLVVHVTFAAAFIDADGFVVDDVESKSNCYIKIDKWKRWFDDDYFVQKIHSDGMLIRYIK